MAKKKNTEASKPDPLKPPFKCIRCEGDEYTVRGNFPDHPLPGVTEDGVEFSITHRASVICECGQPGVHITYSK